MNCFTCLKFKSKLLLAFFVFNSLMMITAQNNDSIIFSIDDQIVYKTEFLNQYQKNNNSNFNDEKLSLADYAELYLKFKLKVKAAKDQGFDTLPGFVKEYQSYRKQLADNYISNGKVTDEMVNDIYYRMTNEVNVSHILLSIAPDATPADTLQTYNTAIDLLKEIDSGENFAELAMKYSKDPSVRTNKGNMGWFKAYKMVYPFETASYELKVGEVSQPVRTNFGYHIIKKNDERPSKGKLVVSHIMKNLKSQDSTYNAEAEINQIYKKVLDGEDFEDLAKQFSDHKPTASNGGKLSPFSVGDINSQKFGDVAFALDKNDSISKPFKTQFGWHIVKYIDNIPVEPLEKIKPDVVKRIKTSDRSKRLIKNIKKDLMQKYNLSINYEALSTLEDRIDDSIFKFKWSYEAEDKDENEWILKIDEHEFMLDEFLDYIQSQQRSLSEKSIGEKVNTAIDKFSYAKLIKTHNQNLESVSPEFAEEAKTYYEGLLLFEVMENQIWQPVQKDSLALKKYFDENSSDFMASVKIDGVIATSSSRKEVKKLKKIIMQEPLEKLKKDFSEIIFQTIKRKSIDDPSLPMTVTLDKDSPEIYEHNGQYLCLYITEIYPAEQLEYKEVRGEIINILQKKEEDKWIDKLKGKYDIYLNKDLINNLQNNLEN